jgi:heme-degrading monooxygenase HmoA
MIHQLRIYEIFEQNKEAFHERFRDHAWQIMRSYGFNVLGMWETKLGDRTEFVYLLVWPDEKTMEHAWEQFKADEEWKRIKKITGAQSGVLVGEIVDRTLTPTEYSPGIVRKELT